MFKLLVVFLRSLLLLCSAILLENVALRHQLTVLQRSAKRPFANQPPPSIAEIGSADFFVPTELSLAKTPSGVSMIG